MDIEKINQLLQSVDGNYLEIGVYYGETFFELAKKNPTRKLYGIDPFISDGWTGQHKGTQLSEAEQVCNQKMKEFPNTFIFKATSKQFAGMPADIKGFNISTVFIDGSHWYDDVVIDTDLAIKMIGKKPGIIIYDDLHIGGVRDALKQGLEKYPQIKPLESPQIFGMGMFYSVNTP